MKWTGIPIYATLLASLLIGCHGPEPVDLSAESAPIAFENRAKRPLGVVAVLWTGGSEQRASEVLKLLPGETLRWAPFAEARTFLAKSPQGSVQSWLAQSEPSTDYSLAVVSLEDSRQLTMERFTYYDLEHHAERPLRVLLNESGALFSRGDSVARILYAR